MTLDNCMILVRTDWPSFADYLSSLSKPARKNFKAITKQYHGVHYWKLNQFPKEKIQHFMRLWEQQLIRGKNVQWAFPVETVETWFLKGDLMVFCAEKDGKTLSMHFIQKRDGYWECHPPMYDKVTYPSLAKWMWFNLISYAIKNKLMHLDLGGGNDDWEYNLKHWKDYKHQYKWHFVPLKAKQNPESEPHYYIGRPACSLRLRD